MLGGRWRMIIEIELREVLRKRGLSSRELAGRIGITEANLSRLVTGKIKAIRLSTLAAICEELDCAPGDILCRADSVK